MQMGGPEMLAHHIAAFASVYTSLSLGQAHMYTLIMLATEVTTPFVNARWILDKLVSPVTAEGATAWVAAALTMEHAWLLLQG